MRLTAFLQSVANSIAGRSERRFAADVLRELGVRPDLEKPAKADQKPTGEKPK